MFWDFISNIILGSISLDFYLEVSMLLFQEVGSGREVIEVWNAYEILDVYLDFSLF